MSKVLHAFLKKYNYINMINKIYFLFLSLCIVHLSANAQPVNNDNYTPRKRKLITTSSGIEGNIFQFSQITNNSFAVRSIPRYSLFFNTGVDANLHASRTIKPFSGLYLRNLGIIQEVDDVKTKRRVYALGIPLGLKFYTMNKELIFKIGGDYNLALNYKEKMFVDGDKKSKFNEWFSDRTPQFFPSLFTGLIYHGCSITLNYYPQNFFNQDFVQSGNKPYEKMEAKMFTLSAGFNMDKSRKGNKYYQRKK
jgi:hypothetical protein